MAAKRVAYGIFYTMENEPVVMAWRILDMQRSPRKIGRLFEL
jgi:hypothetical protein